MRTLVIPLLAIATAAGAAEDAGEGEDVIELQRIELADGRVIEGRIGEVANGRRMIRIWFADRFMGAKEVAADRVVEVSDFTVPHPGADAGIASTGNPDLDRIRRNRELRADLDADIAELEAQRAGLLEDHRRLCADYNRPKLMLLVKWAKGRKWQTPDNLAADAPEGADAVAARFREALAAGTPDQVDAAVLEALAASIVEHRAALATIYRCDLDDLEGGPMAIADTCREMAARTRDKLAAVAAREEEKSRRDAEWDAEMERRRKEREEQLAKRREALEKWKEAQRRKATGGGDGRGGSRDRD